MTIEMAIRKYSRKAILASRESLCLNWVNLRSPKNKDVETIANAKSANNFGKFMGSEKAGIMRRIVAGIESTAYLKTGETSCFTTFI
jgi:hypothetical protein